MKYCLLGVILVGCAGSISPRESASALPYRQDDGPEKPAALADAFRELVASLVLKLSSGNIKIRDEAQARLSMMSPEIGPLIEPLLETSDAEVRHRIRNILFQIEWRPLINPTLIERYAPLRQALASESLTGIMEFGLRHPSAEGWFLDHFEALSGKLVSQGNVAEAKLATDALGKIWLQRKTVPRRLGVVLANRIARWDPKADDDPDREWLGLLVGVALNRVSANDREALDALKAAHDDGQIALDLVQARAGVKRAVPAIPEYVGLSTPSWADEFTRKPFNRARPHRISAPGTAVTQEEVRVAIQQVKRRKDRIHRRSAFDSLTSYRYLLPGMEQVAPFLEEICRDTEDPLAMMAVKHLVRINARKGREASERMLRGLKDSTSELTGVRSTWLSGLLGILSRWPSDEFVDLARRVDTHKDWRTGHPVGIRYLEALATDAARRELNRIRKEGPEEFALEATLALV